MAALNKQEVTQIGQSLYNQPGAGAASAGLSLGGDEGASSADASLYSYIRFSGHMIL